MKNTFVYIVGLILLALVLLVVLELGDFILEILRTFVELFEIYAN